MNRKDQTKMILGFQDDFNLKKISALRVKMLKYFCINYGDQRVLINLKLSLMSQLALLHLNT